MTNFLKLPALEEMSLAQKAAQMVQIDIPDQELSQRTRDHFNKYPWNGVILFVKNVDNRAQVVKLNRDLNALCPITPMLTVDQEGGLVDRFRFAGMNLSPGPMGLAATDSVAATEEAHRIMGLELASLGISLDFAPCLDVNSNPANPVIGVRSFGADAETVIAHGCAALRGLQAGGVGTCAKHFPGHGDTDTDSHIELPSVRSSAADLERIELAPFKAAVEAGVDSIMTAHVTFPALDDTPGLPATLSRPILTGLLREKYGFEGVLFTDSMAMQAVADRFGVGQAAVMSVEAGADVILACGPFENHIATVEALIEAVKGGRLLESRLDQSVERIFALKRRYCRAPEDQPSYPVGEHQSAMAKIAGQSVTVLSEQENSPLPLSGKTLVLIPDLLPQSPLGEVSRSVSLAEVLQDQSATPEQFEEERYHLHGSGDSWRDLSTRAATYERVVVCLYSRNKLPDGQRLLVENLVRDGVSPVVVSFSSPYLFDKLPSEAGTRLLTYNYSPLSLDALARVLLGTETARGHCPVPLAAIT